MKILIVDDEPLIRRSLEKVFVKNGHQVVMAEDGLQGVDLWRKEDPDAVILDVLMPGLTGPEVINEIKPSPQVPIILISAYSGHYDLESVKGLGADLFIEKPFDNIMDIVTELEKLKESKIN
jgi:CheY-like chemotaxis protein